MEKPDVDFMEGWSSFFAIEFALAGHSRLTWGVNSAGALDSH
jgi:hypothetical protein